MTQPTRSFGAFAPGRTTHQTGRCSEIQLSRGSCQPAKDVKEAVDFRRQMGPPRTTIASSLPEPNEPVILQELNHRFSNSLQLISLSIERCSRQTTLSEMQIRLKDLERQLYAHSALHRRLSNLASDDTLENQCRLLCQDLLRIFEREDVILFLHLDDVKIAPVRALCLILLIVELVMNILKHSLVPGERGSIWINLRRTTSNEMVLTVRDGGKPIKTVEAKRQPRIVTALTQSLSGKLVITQNGRYATRISFPADTREDVKAKNEKSAERN